MRQHFIIIRWCRGNLKSIYIHVHKHVVRPNFSHMIYLIDVKNVIQNKNHISMKMKLLLRYKIEKSTLLDFTGRRGEVSNNFRVMTSSKTN